MNSDWYPFLSVAVLFTGTRTGWTLSICHGHGRRRDTMEPGFALYGAR